MHRVESVSTTVASVNSMPTVLAAIPSPPRGVWDLGPIPLRAYALCIVVGIVVAIFWGDKRWIARGGQPGTVLDIAMFAVPFGLVGGRLYHVATDWKTYFGTGGHPTDALKVWQGGLGIWGAVFLGGIGAWIGCRVFKVPLAPFADAIAPGILLAQAIGRVGNYFNQELYGRPTDVPWGLKICERYDSMGNPDNLNGISSGTQCQVVHPTFLYELLWNVLIVLVLVLVDRRFRIGHGRLFALYVAAYCLGRLGVELLRDDPATHVFGVRINVFTAIIVGVSALAYFLLAPNGREDDERSEPPAPPAPDPSAELDPEASADLVTTPESADTEPESAAESGGEPESAAESGGEPGHDDAKTAVSADVEKG